MSFIEFRTSQEWAVWLTSEEQRTLKLYSENPDHLIAEGRQERHAVHDYAGREILELLQNANDAAIDAGLRGRVRIVLSAAGLLVANEGAPFRSDGVASLKLANLSPKYGGCQMVGNKGLGFRAVLNWTRSPMIFSGTLALVFSQRAATARQRRLSDGSESLKVRIADEQRKAGPLVVPLLVFPDFDKIGDVTHLLDQPAQRELHSGAQALRREGFDTVIAMPFDRAGTALAAASAQLAQLEPEILLFARSIAELEIFEVGRAPRRWRHDAVCSDISRVQVGEGEMQEWRIFREARQVPKKLWPQDRPDGMNYEVVVAVPCTPPARQVLYAWFPTETPFPYPVVGHATLDLKADRQHAQDTRTNHFILRRLARVMATAAETIAHERGDDRGLALLATGETMDSLAKFHFRERLRDRARSRALVPTAQGLLPARVARRTAFAENAWLPTRYFPRVAHVGSEQSAAVLAWLDVPKLEVADWREVAERLEFDSLAERAAYIAGLERHKLSDVMECGSLLLDSEGNAVPAGCKVFVGGAVRGNFRLPKWFTERFLHEGLGEALIERLGVQKQEELIVRLASLGLASYSLASVVEGLAAQASRRIEAEPGRETDVRRELVGALYALFPSDEPREARPQFPKRSHVSLQTLAGTYADARKLYLSESYGPRGRILHDLYGSFAPEKLLAPASEQGLLGESEALTEFFRWLGVADAPLDVRLERNEVEKEFVTYVQRSMPKGKFVIGGYPFDKATDFLGYCSDIASIEELPKVLRHASFAAVLAWLATDGRAQTWKGLRSENGKLLYDPGGRAYTRTYEAGIASYIRWKLRTSPWIPTSGGTRVCPRDCLLEPVSAVAKLLPSPGWPSAEALARYSIDRSYLITAFDHAGVLPGFSQMEPEQLYEVLLSLSERDPEGQCAAAFYNEVLRHFRYFADADLRECEARDRFFAEGKIFARRGAEQSYYSRSEVWRLDTNDLPPALRQRLPVAPIREKVGADHVLAVLGLKSVRDARIKREIHNWTPAPAAAEAQAAIEQLKPLVSLRRPSSSDRRMAAFLRLEVRLCTEVTGVVRFLDETVELELGEWDWALDDSNKTAFLRVPRSETEPIGSPFFANAVGEIFARVFGLESGAEFAQLAGCRSLDQQLALLQKLHGEEPVPGWEELVRMMHERRSKAQEIELPIEALAPRIVLPATTPAPATSALTPTAEPRAGTHLSEPLQIEPQPHFPTTARGIDLRVARTVRAGRDGTTSCEPMPGDFCEEKVMEFERADGRFPLYIGNVTGGSGPKADVLSFNSPERRAQFETAGRKDASMVDRFIEVKGRRDGGAKIDLRGNALDAARDYADRYWLYRVTDIGNGHYALAMLQDPLNTAGAATCFYQVDMNHAELVRRVNLIGGCSEAEYFCERNTAAEIAIADGARRANASGSAPAVANPL